MFTGEMVYPWFLEQFGALESLKEVGELLAAKSDWPALYDPEALGRNKVPVAALVYHDDMFVPADLSIETAGRIKGLEPWITNEHEHDGLRADGANVFEKLHARL